GEVQGYSNVQVVSASDGTPIGPTIPNVNRLLALAFSKDGTQLVVSSQSGATIYDVAGLGPPRQLSNTGLASLAVSADGETLATGSSFYRFSDGMLLNVYAGAGFGGMFARDGRRLEIPGAGLGGPTQIWDAATGTPLRQIGRSTSEGNQGSV